MYNASNITFNFSKPLHFLYTERLSSGASGVCSNQLRLVWDFGSKAELQKTALPAGPLQRFVYARHGRELMGLKSPVSVPCPRKRSALGVEPHAGVLWGLGEKIPRLPDYLFSLFLCFKFKPLIDSPCAVGCELI